MNGNEISLKLIGTETANEDVNFDDFIKQLRVLKKALSETSRVHYTKDESRFIVSDLKHSSPSLITLREVPETGFAPSVARDFYTDLKTIQHVNRIPDGFDYSALQAYRDLCLGAKSSVRGATFIYDDMKIDIDPDLPAKIDAMLGRNVFEEGSVTGRMDQVNIHNGCFCTIYPAIRAPRLKGVFDKNMLASVVSGLNNYVTVYGRMTTATHSKYPHEIAIAKIEIHKEEDKIAPFSRLFGIAPDCTDGMDTVEFVRGLRNEWR